MPETFPAISRETWTWNIQIFLKRTHALSSVNGITKYPYTCLFNPTITLLTASCHLWLRVPTCLVLLHCLLQLWVTFSKVQKKIHPVNLAIWQHRFGSCGRQSSLSLWDVLCVSSTISESINKSRAAESETGYEERKRKRGGWLKGRAWFNVLCLKVSFHNQIGQWVYHNESHVTEIN